MDRHPPQPQALAAEDEIDLREIWNLLARNRWLIAGCIAAVVALAWLEWSCVAVAVAGAAAPAVAGFVGAGAPSEAGNFTRSMGEITVAQNPEWTIAAMDFAGVPTGIDIRLVVDSGVVPVINTGIAHREPGIGQVGAGVVKAPLACFQQAIVAIAKDLGVS